MSNKKKDKRTWIRVGNALIAVPVEEADYIELSIDEGVMAIRFFHPGKLDPFYCIPCGILSPVPNKEALIHIFEQLSRRLTHD